MKLDHDCVSYVARLFRLGMTAKANDEFAKLIDILSESLANKTLSIEPVTLNALINRIFQAQIAGDYLYLSDLLEHELLQYLED